MASLKIKVYTITSVFPNHISFLKKNGDHENGNEYCHSVSHLCLFWGVSNPAWNFPYLYLWFFLMYFSKWCEFMTHPPLWPLLFGKPCTSLSWSSSIDDKGNDAQTKDTASSCLWIECPLWLWKCLMQARGGTWLLWFHCCHQGGGPCLLAASYLTLVILMRYRTLPSLDQEEVTRRSLSSWYPHHTSQSLSEIFEGKKLIQY